MSRNIVKIYDNEFFVCKNCFDLIVFGKEAEDVIYYHYGADKCDEIINHTYASYDKMTNFEHEGVEYHLRFAHDNDDKYVEFSKKPCDCCNSLLHGARYCLSFYE